VAQTFPTSAKVIYDTLVADTAFMALLGTYRFAAGAGPTAAISVLSPGESMPELRNVEGLECIIMDAADINRKDYLTDTSDLTYSWRVFLVCWPEATGQKMTDAASIMLKRFAGATSFETVAVTDGLGAEVQTQILIPSDKPILA
jgi:hypothetical protein